MIGARANSIRKLLADLTVEFIDTKQYFDDLEPQGFYDTALRGKLLALKSYLELLDRKDLAESVEHFLPLHGNAFEALTFVSDHVTPEVLALLDSLDEETLVSPPESFWDFIHPRVKAIAKPRFDAALYADAVEAAVKEVNLVVKEQVVKETGDEKDGGSLMTHAFSKDKPIIRLADGATETGRNIQQGYMLIFQGAMIGIRNPKAHNNHETDKSEAVHLIFLSSLLMTKYDERI